MMAHRVGNTPGVERVTDQFFFKQLDKVRNEVAWQISGSKPSPSGKGWFKPTFKQRQVMLEDDYSAVGFWLGEGPLSSDGAGVEYSWNCRNGMVHIDVSYYSIFRWEDEIDANDWQDNPNLGGVIGYLEVGTDKLMDDWLAANYLVAFRWTVRKTATLNVSSSQL